jgi:peroxiredoxin
MRADIVPGARFPDYELPDRTGRKRKLSELQGDAPMIVFLSRGFYCPKDRRQAMNLVAFEPELKVGYAKLVTISTDDLLATNENRDGLGAHWPFVSDPAASCRRTSTSRSTPTPCTTRWCRTRWCSPPSCGCTASTTGGRSASCANRYPRCARVA